MVGSLYRGYLSVEESENTSIQVNEFMMDQILRGKEASEALLQSAQLILSALYMG
jgi:hypothetical protein